MFDLEKFKTGVYYVHLPTQEIYDEAMKFLEENGISWRFREATHYKAWHDYKEETSIGFQDYILYADKTHYEEEGFKELELNIEKTKLKVGDKVRIKSYQDDPDIMQQGDIGYIAYIDRSDFYPYSVVKDKELMDKDVSKLRWNEYDIFHESQLEKLHSHEEVKEIFSVGRLHTDIIKDYIDYKFEEAIKEEAVKVNNIIPNSNIEFIKSVELNGEGDSLVKSPNHYIGELGLEVEEVLRNFIPRYEDAYVAHRVASAIEYLLRSPLKNGTQDLEKARYNIGQALEHIRKNK